MLPIPGAEQSLQFLSKDSMAQASNYGEITATLLKPEFVSKLEELRSFLQTTTNRLKGFVSLTSFGAFLKEAVGFVRSDQHEQKLQILFNRNYQIFEKSLITQFTAHVVHELNETRRLTTSFARVNGNRI